MNQRRRRPETVRPVWAVEVEADSLAHFDRVCQLRGITREEGAREALTWFTAKSAVWLERARQRRIAELQRHADSWDPLTDYLGRLSVAHHPLNQADDRADRGGNRQAHQDPVSIRRHTCGQGD